jgi:RNA polymerase sigma-70 factor (ECF subfamily)
MDRTPVSLLERLRQPGEQQAWNRFVALYTPLIHFWACRLGLREDAADLVQDVFAILLRKMPEFRYDPQGSFRSWLRTVALNAWRARHRRTAGDPAPAGPAPLENLEVPDGLVEFTEAEYRSYLAARAAQLMQAQFEPATWKAFWALVVEGRPVTEVAAELGLTANAVYIAKSRVLARLRQELDGLLD